MTVSMLLPQGSTLLPQGSMLLPQGSMLLPQGGLGLLLAQVGTVPGGADTSMAEAITFWILGPVALAGALGMVFARNAVHSALCLAGTMLSLGLLYMAQGAMFLGFVQIIVYTGAVMMLFLFVLMLVGRDSSDSVVEVLRGQRSAALLFGLGFAVLLVGAVGQAFADVTPVGLEAGGANWNGNAPGLGLLIFTKYLFAFELTSALLITAALGAMVLGYAQTRAHAKRGQRATVEARLRGEHARPSPLPGPGVFATANSVAVPALLPDGSIAPESLAEIIDQTEVKLPPEPLADDPRVLTAHPPSDRSVHDGADHADDRSRPDASGGGRSGHDASASHRDRSGHNASPPHSDRSGDDASPPHGDRSGDDASPPHSVRGARPAPDQRQGARPTPDHDGNGARS